LTNCVFSENISYHYEGTSNDAAGKGGGLTCYRSAAALVNCTFYGNVAEPPNTSTGGKGGGIYCVKASPLVERTIIAFNESDGIYCDSAVSNPMLYCCNVYGNDNGLGDWVGCILTQDNVADNFSAHPRFRRVHRITAPAVNWSALLRLPARPARLRIRTIVVNSRTCLP